MFANKVVLVTGGSSGIGAAAATCFAKEGATLAIVGRNEAKLKDVAKRCEKLKVKTLVIKADVTKDDEAKNIIKQTIDNFGRLDVLVNNAGIAKFVTVEESNLLAIYDEIMNTNLRSILQITNLAVPYLKETKGNIVNVSSIASLKVVATGMGPYSISKAGIDLFTRSSALELASSGVRVNCINPGPVKTELFQISNSPGHLISEMGKIEDRTALGRLSEAEEIGDLILYLASDKARSVTGSSYVIDNGILLK